MSKAKPSLARLIGQWIGVVRTKGVRQERLKRAQDDAAEAARNVRARLRDRAAENRDDDADFFGHFRNGPPVEGGV